MAFLKGLGLGAGLIIAIGAQNVFVLSHSLRRNYALSIALVCSLVDASLILIGVWGLGAFIERNPRLLVSITLAGVAFLFTYGILAFRRALVARPLEASERSGFPTLGTAVAASLAISLLNPHVYLDTVLLLGSIGAQLPANQPGWFALGAMTASFVWFFTLAWGGQALAPILKNAAHWQRLDILIGILMWVIAGNLLWSLLQLIK